MENKHSFIKGLNRDIAKNKFPNDAYYYLLNGRVLASDDATMSDIVNVKGNTTANINDNSVYPTDYSIIGYTTLRNDIILFYAKNTSITVDDYTSISKIHKLEYLGNDAYKRYELWSGIGLNFRIDKPIRATSKYESSLLQKIYWTDDNNLLKQANIAVDISTQIADEFDIIGNLITSTGPVFSDYTSGSLKQGAICYAYRLIKKNGYKTSFSDTSELIPIGSNIYSGQTIRKAYGDSIYDPNMAYNTGKGIVLAVYIYEPDYLEFYDYIELVSLWYSSDSAIPDVNIISKTFLETGVSTYRIIDTGTNSYGTLTYSEFVNQNYAFKAKDIVSKDNRLFLANITEEYFDIDTDATWTGKVDGDVWDARAYRFDDTLSCELCSNDIGTVEYTLTGPTPLYSSVSLDANAINIFNNLTVDTNAELNSDSKQQKYQINGTTLGGTGLNISYNFTKINNYLSSGATLSASLDGIIGNKSQLGIIKGFQRSEVYRFGIVFFDNKGRQSFVKWIGDIRIPTLGELALDYVTHENLVNEINAISIHPNFTISNHPSINGVNLDWQIVYVKRDETDKGVVAAGMLSPNMRDASSNTWTASRPRTINEYEAASDATPGMNKYSMTFMSPEINFREKESLSYEFFEIAGDLESNECMFRYIDDVSFSTYSDTGEMIGASRVYIRRLTNCGEATNYSRVGVDDYTKAIPPTSKEFSFTLGVDQVHPSSFIDFDPGLTASPHGTCFINRISDIISAPGLSDGYFYAYARKPVFGSQYGGPIYNVRQSNTYIPAGGINLGSVSTSQCTYGDIYSTIFEYGEYFYQDPATYGVDASYTDFIYMGCESSINCLFNTNDSYSRKYFINPRDIAQINENPYTNINTGVTLTGLYGYNSAYSKLNDSKKFFPKPSLFNQIEVFSCKVKYSDLKIENEDIDSWLVYRTNNYKTANEAYGPVNRVVEFQDRVFSFQDNAFSMISINPRVTQQSQDGVMIILGSGDIIDKFNYLSTDIGCQDNSEVIKSISAIYWLDKNKKKIYSFNGQIETLTDLKGLQSYLYNNTYENTIFNGTYDISNSEVLMTLKDSSPNVSFLATFISGTDWYLVGHVATIETPFVVGRVYRIGNGYFTYVSKSSTSYRFTYSHGTTLTNGLYYDLSEYITEKDNFTIAYSEKLQAFTSFYSFIPTLYVYHNKGFFSSIDNNALYQHNVGTKYNTFYNITSPTTLKLIANYGSQAQGEFTNIKFFAEVRNTLGDLIPNATITNISLKDSTQISQDIILYPIHLVEEGHGARYVLDTSGLRLGNDWYTGLSTPVEGLVVNNNELYRNNHTAALTTSPPNTGWGVAELCNIRKTNNQWHTQLPRFTYLENNSGNPDYNMSNRFRSDWLEITIEFKDMMPGINLYDRKFKISDITLISTPLQF